jgi:hypothetical protein
MIAHRKVLLFSWLYGEQNLFRDKLHLLQSIALVKFNFKLEFLPVFFKRRFSRMPFLPGTLTPAYPRPWHARSFRTNCPEAGSGAALPTGISHSDGHVFFKLQCLVSNAF